MVNIVLTGFMGTGKTTIGKRLASELGLKFVDTDKLIEEEAKLRVSEIFSIYGEGRFREIEKNIIKKLSSGSFGNGLVVSTGGGAVIAPENRAAIRSWAKVICLKATADAILKRVKDNEVRPLLNLKGDDKRAAVVRLLKEREEAYRDSDLELDTTDLGVEGAVKIIREFLEHVDRQS